MKIFPRINLELIQSIRLVHALMESSYDICLLLEHDVKFAEIRKKFGVKYFTLTEGCKDIPAIQILHKEPRTILGCIERPLIFPHSIPDYCRSIWPGKRTIKFSFAGLITSGRKATLEKWAGVSLPTHNANREERDVLGRVGKMVQRQLGRKTSPKTEKKQFGDLIVWSSERGRTFPIKSWDDEYFDLLTHSEFVLCPEGDYVWSYRFFEAAMCGAIPVIETFSPVFEGFHFRTMEELHSDLSWSREQAEHNYTLSRDRLTVPLMELNAELSRLLG